MEHIVLEYDESTRTALVVATSNKREPVLSGHASPYIVADGYDFESRSWGAGHYFTDIAAAKIDYERSCRHSYPLAEGKLRDDEFCTIRWCREDVATSDIRGLTDAELAIEIEKAGAAMVEHVDAHMAHVHGLGGGDGDSAAYYAARKRYADLRLEKGRRLRAPIDRGQRESQREPQAMAAAAAKAALHCDGAELGRGGKKQ